MFLIREVMHCKPGKVNELVSRFKQLGGAMKEMGYEPFRVMTDVSGEEFWTVVAETSAAALDEYAEMTRKTMSDPKTRDVMKGYHDFVVSGRREIYKIEA